MAENPIQLHNIQYRRLFPWLYLFRAFWIAIDIRKLILAAAALTLVSAGSLLCDQLPFGAPRSIEEAAEREVLRWPWQQYDIWLGAYGTRELRSALRDPRNVLQHAWIIWNVVLVPFREFVEPASVLFQPDATASQVADAATRSLIHLIVWSIFGGAITRIAAMQFARDQQIGIRRALAFSASRFFGYFSAPLMPLVGVAILWGLCVVGGWIGRIPGGIGEALLGILWGLELLFGFLMVVILIGVALGWPLMFATISVEGTDGFDGLSRAYNYVFERPLYSLWQATVSLLFGSVAIVVIWLTSQILVELAVWGVSWGLGYDATAQLIAGAPGLDPPGAQASTAAAMTWGAQFARGWMCALAALVIGFVHTFFWSAATIAYFVLRHSVDANDFHEVYVEEAEEKDELLPLVGTAAMGEIGENASPGPNARSAAPSTPPSPPPVDLSP